MGYLKLSESKHRIISFPSSRQFTLDVGKLGIQKHHIKALMEIDVTDSRKRLKELRAQDGIKISFTSWIIKCISQAVSENKQVHALRMGARRLVLFDDVDVSIMVEREVDDTLVPLPMVVRNAANKTASEIFVEIRKAQQITVTNGQDYVLDDSTGKGPIKFFTMLPQWLRLPVWKFILSNPYRVKNMMGTVLVTSVGMAGSVKGWAIPYSIHPICFVIGSIVKKPGVIRNKVEIREYLEMTVLIDHDVVDGIPAARFITCLTDKITKGYNLDFADQSKK